MFEYEKVEIRKQFFAGYYIKNVKPTTRLFYVKPCKKLFSVQNLSLWNHKSFYFFKQKSMFTTLTGNVLFTSLLHLKKVKQVDWKSIVKTWKWYSFFQNYICIYILLGIQIRKSYNLNIEHIMPTYTRKCEWNFFGAYIETLCSELQWCSHE